MVYFTVMSFKGDIILPGPKSVFPVTSVISPHTHTHTHVHGVKAISAT